MALNEHALLYNGVRKAELDSVILKGKSKTTTPKETDDGQRIVNIEFVNNVKNNLKSEIEDLKRFVESKLGDSDLNSKTDSAYVYKGDCYYNELPKSGNSVGDVWNVLDEHDDIPAGTNYAWTGDKWDNLGGQVIIDTISNQETEEIIEDIYGIDI